MTPFEGPVLGIDHGAKFIGLALSRTLQIAEPLMVIERKSKKADFARINEVIAREGIRAIVLGLPPKPPDFDGHSQADTVRNWAAHLENAVVVPIFLWTKVCPLSMRRRSWPLRVSDGIASMPTLLP